MGCFYNKRLMMIEYIVYSLMIGFYVESTERISHGDRLIMTKKIR